MLINKQLMDFPCNFTIKVMGVNHVNLVNEVVAVISRYSDGFDPNQDITTRLSSNSNYVAISAVIKATSKEQLDTIYLALNKHELVKVTL
jgi:hypothetical protein